MMTLWAIFRSPLMFGGELRDNDDWTLSLLTNKQVIEVNQNSHNNRLIYRKGNKIVWAANNDQCHTYVALFNAGEETARIEVTLEQLGLSKGLQARDLWKQEEAGIITDGIGQTLAPHSALLLKLY